MPQFDMVSNKNLILSFIISLFVFIFLMKLVIDNSFKIINYENFVNKNFIIINNYYNLVILKKNLEQENEVIFFNTLQSNE